MKQNKNETLSHKQTDHLGHCTQKCLLIGTELIPTTSLKQTILWLFGVPEILVQGKGDVTKYFIGRNVEISYLSPES